MEKIKYPRTLHLPYSEKTGSDDKILPNDDCFKGKNVVVTIKMDGENTTIYKDTSHARSKDSIFDLEGRRWIEMFRIYIQSKIDPDMRLCGENMFYKHTCQYNDLESMFYGFSIWKDDICLPFDETLTKFTNLNIPMPPLIYRGEYDAGEILSAFRKYQNSTDNDVEGFVIRLEDSYKYEDFSNSVAKFVCEDFEIPDDHWRHSQLIVNKLNPDINPWKLLYQQL